MKKYSWIMALLLALTLAFIGCPTGGGGGGDDDDDDTPRALVTVFDMQDSDNGIVSHGIQDLPVGPLSFPTGVNPIVPLVRAAEDQHASYEIIEVEGKKALKYVTHADWGPGFDLPNAVFGFFGGNETYPDGDTITITGTATGAPIDLALNKNQGGAQAIVGNRITTEGDFEVVATLTAADVNTIKGNEQNVLRFEDRKGETTVTIYNIVIEGYRPTEVKKLAKPAIALAEGSTTVITWTAVADAAGYTLSALAEDADDPTEFNLGPTVTSWDIAMSTLDPTEYTEAAVKYTITLIALGTPGVSEDSDPSDALEITKQPPAPPPSVNIKIGGTDATAQLFAVAGTFVEIKDDDDATKTIGYTFTRGGGYEASYAYLKVDLGTAKLSDFSQVKFTYAGVSGDLGYKDIQLRASLTAPSGSIAAPVVNKPRYDTWATYQSGTATGILAFGTGPQLNNADNDGPVILKVEPTLATTLTGEVYISIFFSAAATGAFGGAGSPTVFSASDIEFIAATDTAIAHDVYFTTKKDSGIILAVVNVADNGTATPTLPQADPAKYTEYYNAFIADAGSITGWKNKADDTAFVPGTATVTKDTVLYAETANVIAEFDLEALEELAGGITISVGGTNAPTFDANTKVLTVIGSSSTIFYFTFADAGITPDPTAGTAKITYACVLETGTAKAIAKNDANSWTDTNPQQYPTFAPSTLTTQTHELSIAISSLATGATGITFQHNVDGNDGAKYYLKIISVEVEGAGGGGELGETTELTVDSDVGNGTTQQGWTVNPIWDEVLAAKYLVLETEGIGDNKDGFGGLQIILNREGFDNQAQTAVNGDWTSFNREDGTIFLVIQLDTLEGYDDFIEDEPTWAQILVGYYGTANDAFEDLGLEKAYLTTTELLPAPAGSVALTNNDTTYGYIAKGIEF